MAQAAFKQNGMYTDYTPATATTAGSVVIQGDLVGVPSDDIAANVQGSVCIDGIHTATKAAGVAFSVGDRVYWDVANSVATRTHSGNKYLGLCVKAAATSDTTVDVNLEPTGAGSAGLLFNETTASSAVTNTVAETAFDQSFSIPANTLKAGDLLRIRAQAIAPATNSTDTLNLKLKIGSTVILATGAVDVANNDVGVIDCDLVVRTVGATGTIVAMGWTSLGTPGTATAKPGNLASTTIDTTAAQAITVTATWSVANAGDSCRLDILSCQLMRN